MSRNDADPSQQLLEKLPSSTRPALPVPGRFFTISSVLSHTINLTANITWLLMLRTQDTRSSQIVPNIDGQYNPRIIHARWAAAALLTWPMAMNLVKNCTSTKGCAITPPTLTVAALFTMAGFFTNIGSTLVSMDSTKAVTAYLCCMGAYTIAHLASALHTKSTAMKLLQSVDEGPITASPIRKRYHRAEKTLALSQLALALSTMLYFGYAFADKMPDVKTPDAVHFFFCNSASFITCISIVSAVIANLIKLSTLCLQQEPALKQQHQDSLEGYRTESNASSIAIDFSTENEQPRKTPEPDDTPGVVTVTVENPLLKGLAALNQHVQPTLEAPVTEKARSYSLG
ncbi:MAG: hypothetical protein P1U40_10270 [Coxiellaceae bacterium]|nr:hypothetical protein [Coxiellaceae bacterium]